MKRKITIALFLITLSQARAQDLLQPILEIQPLHSGMQLGEFSLGLGDINGDGYPDFAVSRDSNLTYIYFGGPGIFDGVPDVTIHGGGMMAMGDLNGDGKMDLIVHTEGDTLGIQYIYVYFGKSAPGLMLDTTPDLKIREEKGTTEFGYSFAVGDLNGDGFDDLVVGAPFYGDLGKTYLYFGKSTMTSNPDFSVIGGDSMYDDYGIRVKIADINGDGIKDLAIGADRKKQEATLDIYYGKPGFTFTKENYSQRLTPSNTGLRGIFWFNLLDVNNDGKVDLSCPDSGKEYFFFGKADSLSLKPSLVLIPDPNSSGNYYGDPAQDIGDVNNDGKRDFALRAGSSPCAYVFLGGSFIQNSRVAGRCNSSDVGSALETITAVGDVNGDGVNDFATGIPSDGIPGIVQDGYFVIYSGNKKWVTSVKKEVQQPEAFRLYQNYPNPFNPQTTISYNVATRGFVKLKVYDLLGREVGTLIKQMKEPGLHQVPFDATGLPSGLYFYQLILNGQIQTRKMLFLQ